MIGHSRCGQIGISPRNILSRNDLTERVWGAVFEVANALGAGFLEGVYERALLNLNPA